MMIKLIVLGIALIVIGIIFFAISVSCLSEYNEPNWLMGCLIGIIICVIGAIITSKNINKYNAITNTPERIHQQLLNNIDKAEKDLQKFYIDHPEFKEIE